MPGRATYHLQVALLKAFAIGAIQTDIVIGWPVQRCGRHGGLRVQALIVRASAVGERHIAPVLHGLCSLNAWACVQHQDGVPCSRKLVGNQCAYDACANNHHIGAGISVLLNLCFLHRGSLVLSAFLVRVRLRYLAVFVPTTAGR